MQTNNKIIYMDGYDEVRDSETQSDLVFSTKLPSDIKKHFDRDIIVPSVIDNVVNIWNKGGNVDEYLLDEGDCSQEEREIIVEGLYDYYNRNNQINN